MMNTLNDLLPLPTVQVPSKRCVVHRTRGQRHGPITRLMSPSDLGELLRPFVFLDHFDTASADATRMGLHPHSGIATVTWIMEGNISYEDTTGETGKVPQGGLQQCVRRVGAEASGDLHLDLAPWAIEAPHRVP